MLEQSFAVVADEDDHGVVEQAARFELAAKISNLLIREGQVAVIQAAHVIDLLGGRRHHSLIDVLQPLVRFRPAFALRLRDGGVGTEEGVERGWRVIGLVRLAVVHVGEKARAVLLHAVEERGHDVPEAAGLRSVLLPGLVELLEAAIETVIGASDAVRHEARGVNPLRGEDLGQHEPVFGKPGRERQIAMMPVGLLRRPHRRHRGERISRGGIGVVEGEPLAREAVDVRGRLPGVAVGAEREGAGSIEHDEEDVRFLILDRLDELRRGLWGLGLRRGRAAKNARGADLREGQAGFVGDHIHPHHERRPLLSFERNLRGLKGLGCKGNLHRLPSPSVGRVERDPERALPSRGRRPDREAALEFQARVFREAKRKGGLRGAGQDDRRHRVLLADFPGARRLALAQQVEGLVLRVADGETEDRGGKVAGVSGSGDPGLRELKVHRVGAGLRGLWPVEPNARAIRRNVLGSERPSVDADLEPLVLDTLVGLEIEDQGPVTRLLDLEAQRRPLARPEKPLVRPRFRVAVHPRTHMRLGIRPAEHDEFALGGTGGERETVGEIVDERGGSGRPRPIGPKTGRGQEAEDDQDGENATHQGRWRIAPSACHQDGSDVHWNVWRHRSNSSTSTRRNSASSR